MKKIYLTLATCITVFCAYSQNTVWPSTTATSNVGIGTTTPGSKLHVVGLLATPPNMSYMSTGNIPFKVQTRPDANYGLAVFDSNTNSAIQSGDIVNGTGITSLNLQPFDGNVGIGTTNPAYKLDIYKGATGTALNITGAAIGTRNDVSMDFSAVNAVIATYARIGLQITNGATGSETGGLTFSTVNGGSVTEKMFINAIGNVGIGTTSPTRRFVISNYGAEGLELQPSSTGGYANLISYNRSTSTWNNFKISASNIIFGCGSTETNEAMRINSSGNIGIGTTNPDQKLSVKGTIHSQEVIVDMNVLPDYVFKPKYNLPSLTDVKTYIDQNHHLPEIPSAEQVAKDGLSLGDMNIKLLKKVEELTLYLIQQKEEADRQNKAQQKQINELKSQVVKLIK